MKKVMVIDDDKEFLLSIKSVLESSEITVITVQDPRESLRYLFHEVPHIVVSDINMPGIDGTMLVELGSYVLKDIFYIYISANSLEEIKEKYPHFNHEINFFQKPLDDVFLDKINKLLAENNQPMVIPPPKTNL